MTRRRYARRYAAYLWHRARLRIDLNRGTLTTTTTTALLAALAAVALAVIVVLVTMRLP